MCCSSASGLWLLWMCPVMLIHGSVVGTHAVACSVGLGPMSLLSVYMGFEADPS